MAVTITVPGASGAAPLVFKVTGSSASNYAKAFEKAVGTDTVNVLSNAGAAPTAGSNVLNEIFSNSSTTGYALLNGGQSTLVDVGISTTVTGSTAGGDTVLGTGATTYDAVGNGNQVTFVDGANVYNGGAATDDTITGGAGSDSINTGTGFSTVFSGAGSALVTLNDSVGSASTAGGLAYLGDGHATVVANGLFDDVVAATNGQTIFGGTDSSSTLNIAIEDNTTSSGAAGDVITAGAGTTTVFDSVGGNSIFGGAGVLRFVGGTPAASDSTVPGTSSVLADSIYGGGGSSFIFGASGDSLTFAGDTSGSVSSFLAGAGNETLNAVNADGRVNFYGSSYTSSSETLVGSKTGFNYFVTGGNASTVMSGSDTTGGSESIMGGTGTNIFGIADGGSTAHITIFDFASGNDSVSFLGQTASETKADLAAATVNATGLTVTLSDNTTVTFVGLNSISQLHTPGSGS